MDPMPTPSAGDSDAGLVRRGLMLLGLMAALAVIVVAIVMQGRRDPSANDAAPTQPFLLPAPMPLAAFPASAPWAELSVLDEHLPSAVGWEIRYNATLAQARRGSPQVRWSIIREMLDQRQQERNFPAKLHAGRIVPDQEAALRTIYSTLTALAEWHKKQERSQFSNVPAELQQVYADVDRLADSPHTQLRVQADRVRQTFFRD